MTAAHGESIALGDWEISRVNDAVYWWDGGAIFGVVPKTLWSRKAPADEWNRVPLAFNCYLIRCGNRKILIETGLGDKRDARMRSYMNVPAQTESLPETLRRRDIDPDSIDMVINSHLHWDHASGNTVMRGESAVAAFPKARYFASRGELEHARERHMRDAVSYVEADYEPLVAAGQMTLVEDDYEVAPGIWMRRAPGHNRDMMVITAENRGETFCFFSDLVPTIAHVQPTWIAAFDLDPIRAIENKLKWLGAAADGGWWCGFGHETERPLTRIVRDAKAQFAAA